MTFDDSDNEDRHSTKSRYASEWQHVNPQVEEKSFAHSAIMQEEAEAGYLHTSSPSHSSGGGDSSGTLHTALSPGDRDEQRRPFYDSKSSKKYEKKSRHHDKKAFKEHEGSEWSKPQFSSTHEEESHHEKSKHHKKALYGKKSEPRYAGRGQIRGEDLTSEGHIIGTSSWKIPTQPLKKRFDHHEKEHESFFGPSSEPKSFEPEIPSSRQPSSSWSPPFAPDREQRSTHPGQTESKWSPSSSRPSRDEPSFQESGSRSDKKDKQDRREPERQTKQDERSTWDKSQKSKKESPFSSRDKPDRRQQPEESRRPLKKDEDKKFGPDSKKTGEEDFMEGVRKLFFLNLSTTEYQQDDNSFNTAFLY